jgi:hypothetical protein
MIYSILDKNVALVQQLEAYIPVYQKINTAVSNENLGWHIAHSCMVINSITNAIAQSNPLNAKPVFSATYYWVLLTNNIPRGKAKAPNIVIPKQSITQEQIEQEIELAKANLQTLAATQKDKYFTHPIFGDLNVTKTLRFFIVHTNHHLKIIRDIH